MTSAIQVQRSTNWSCMGEKAELFTSQLASIKNTIILFVCPPKILHKHCFQFLLGLTMIPRETGNKTYAEFWVDKQRVLWYFWYWLMSTNPGLNFYHVFSFPISQKEPLGCYFGITKKPFVSMETLISIILIRTITLFLLELLLGPTTTTTIYLPPTFLCTIL